MSTVNCYGDYILFTVKHETKDSESVLATTKDPLQAINDFIEYTWNFNKEIKAGTTKITLNSTWILKVGAK